MRIGTDIIEISRIAESLKLKGFADHVYTRSELEYYEQSGARAETLAGVFCAKEAGGNAAFIASRLIYILTLCEQKRPYVKICAAKYVSVKAVVSISHCREYATAVCVAE